MEEMLWTGSNTEEVLEWVNGHTTYGLCGDLVTNMADFLPEKNVIRLETGYVYVYANPGDIIQIPLGDFPSVRQNAH